MKYLSLLLVSLFIASAFAVDDTLTNVPEIIGTFSQVDRDLRARSDAARRSASTSGCLDYYEEINNAGASLSLAGSWNVQLDPKDEGLAQTWFAAAHPFAGSMAMPGTTDEAGLGTPAKKPNSVLRGLQRKVTYEGAVWFRRSIEIPADWAGKVVTLELERVLWESRVWLDGKEMGMENSLSTPHWFTLSGCTPGPHELVVRVDNRKQIEIGKSHAYIDDTQTKWNGIVGRIELHAEPLVRITTLWLNPDPAKPSVRVNLENGTDKSVTGMVMISLASSPKTTAVDVSVNAPPGESSMEIPLDKWGPLPKWDEFHPNLSSVQFQLKTSLGEQTRELAVGLRTIQRDGQILRINGRPLFLRGTHEGCSFPLTGYPPMDVAGWRAVFKEVKLWGLNHVRFHSYCPPEACFTAADEEGVYLQIELPLWVGKIGAAGDEKRTAWIHSEAMRILTRYGNHPSILMMALGNELEGEFSYLGPLVQELQKLDPRRLYSLTSNRLYARIPANAGKPGGPVLADDFKVERLVKVGLRGQSYFNSEPNTVINFRGALKGERWPVITHEAGQWCVFPNMAEIPKYTGVLRPVNLEAIQQDLKGKGMLEQAADFTRCSGKLSFELDKQELELAMRSHPLSGYQLLDLHDYPGQGTAHVGLLDSFWQSKGFATPEQFREACAPVVPLALLPKRVFTAGETLAIKVEGVNYSEGPLHDITPVWTLVSGSGQPLLNGKLASVELPVGAGIPLGEIQGTVPDVAKATEAVLQIRLPGEDAGSPSGKPALQGADHVVGRASREAGAWGGGDCMNSWRIWIYPATKSSENKADVLTTSFNDALARLQQGRRVLYCPPRQGIKAQHDVVFLPAFWSPVYFSKQAGTLGLLIHPEHPALADFPTAEHSDWQWWYPLEHTAGAVVLDGVNSKLKPVVQVIPSFSHVQKLGMIFEARVGEGRLLVCTIDLTGGFEADPVRRQLRESLFAYLAGTLTDDCAVLTEPELGALFQEAATGAAQGSKPAWSKDLEPPKASKASH